MQCTTVLSQDHIIIRQSLDVLDGMVHTLESGDRIELADVTAILNFLRRFADEYHQATEEEVFFPALLRRALPAGAFETMFREHSEEREAIAEIETALNPKSGKAFVAGVRRLTSVLGDHLAKEDALFPRIAEQCLSKELDDLLVVEFHKRRIQPETLLNFVRLDRKYKRTSTSGLRVFFGRGAAASSPQPGTSYR